MAGKIFSSNALAVMPNIPQGRPVDMIPPLQLPSSLGGLMPFFTEANGGGGGGGILANFANSGYGQAMGGAANLVTSILGGSAQQQNNDNIFGLVGGAAQAGMGALNKAIGLKNLASGPWGAVANMGTGILSKALGKSMDYDDKAGQAMSAVTGVVKMAGPVGLAVGTALDLVNMIGSKKVEGTTTDTVNTNEVASAYNTSNYEMGDQNISGIGRLFGADDRRKKKVRENQMKLDMIADIGKESRDDRLGALSSVRNIANRNMMDVTGGYRALHVKKGGVLVNPEFLKACKKKMQDGGEVAAPQMPIDFVERMEVKNGTKGTIGKTSKETPSKNKKVTEDGVKKVQKEGNKNSLSLGLNNLLNLYGNNVVSAQEGIKLNSERKFIKPDTYPHNPGYFGGWKSSKDLVMTPVRKPRKPDNTKKAFVKKSYGTATSGVLGFKKGGVFNIIPEGSLHKERHHMEDIVDGMEHVTRKGIPVVTTNKAGEMKQQAEIERDEIIFNKKLSVKLEELKKAYDDGDNSAAIEAGRLLSEEILFNTKDYTGLIKQTKTA